MWPLCALHSYSPISVHSKSCFYGSVSMQSSFCPDHKFRLCVYSLTDIKLKPCPSLTLLVLQSLELGSSHKTAKRSRGSHRGCGCELTESPCTGGQGHRGGVRGSARRAAGHPRRAGTQRAREGVARSLAPKLFTLILALTLTLTLTLTLVRPPTHCYV